MGTGITDVIGGPHDFLPPRSDEFQKLWWVRRDRMVFWIYNYLYNECPSPLTFQSCSLKGVLDPTLYDKVLSDLRQVNGFSSGTPISSTNKTDHHETTNMIKAKLYKNVHWMVLYKLYVFCSDMKFKMVATAGLSLTLDPMGKMFQNASSLKPLGQLKPNCPGMIIGRSSTNFIFFMPIGNPRWLPPQYID